MLILYASILLRRHINQMATVWTIMQNRHMIWIKSVRNTDDVILNMHIDPYCLSLLLPHSRIQACTTNIMDGDFPGIVSNTVILKQNCTFYRFLVVHPLGTVFIVNGTFDRMRKALEQDSKYLSECVWVCGCESHRFGPNQE